MAAFYNRIVLIGNLTRDPQITQLPSQTPVVEFGLAVNRTWKDSQGNKREDTCFVDCRAFGRQAEVIHQYVTKGRSLLVEGRLEYHTWEAQDGSKRSKHRVFVENFQFMDSQTAPAAEEEPTDTARPARREAPARGREARTTQERTARRAAAPARGQDTEPTDEPAERSRSASDRRQRRRPAPAPYDEGSELPF